MRDDLRDATGPTGEGGRVSCRPPSVCEHQRVHVRDCWGVLKGRPLGCAWSRGQDGSVRTECREGPKRTEPERTWPPGLRVSSACRARPRFGCRWRWRTAPCLVAPRPARTQEGNAGTAQKTSGDRPRTRRTSSHKGHCRTLTEERVAKRTRSGPMVRGNMDCCPKLVTVTASASSERGWTSAPAHTRHDHVM